MRRLTDSRIALINDLIRRRAAKNGRKLLNKMLTDQAKLQAYLTHRLAELEAQALAGDQRIRDDLGSAILSIVEAHNDSCEAIVQNCNAIEHSVRTIAETVMREPIDPPGRIPDNLNRRPNF